MKCDVCTKAIIDHSWIIPESSLVNIQTKLKHPNTHFYKLIVHLETIFQKNCEASNVLELLFNQILVDNLISFPCEQHENEVVPYIVYHFVHERMR